MDLPIKHGDFPWFFVRLPEGNMAVSSSFHGPLTLHRGRVPLHRGSLLPTRQRRVGRVHPGGSQGAGDQMSPFFMDCSMDFPWIFHVFAMFFHGFSHEFRGFHVKTQSLKHGKGLIGREGISGHA